MNHLEDLLSSLLVLAWMVEARDPYTGGHLWRVSQFCRLLAIEAGWPEAEIGRAVIGGFLHDLGKVGVPDAVLNKPERLSWEEFEVMRTHPGVGMRVLAGHPLAKVVKNSILSHHETPDGKGYPNGLSGSEIPAEARLVGICDAFDAMTSSRPYRRGMPVTRALEIIEGRLGQQFDRDLGALFLRRGYMGALNRIVGHSDEGIPLKECPMCGPIVVMVREQSEGDLVYCRNCSSEFSITLDSKGHSLTPTGRRGTPREVEPQADIALIERLLSEATRVVAFSELLEPV